MSFFLPTIPSLLYPPEEPFIHRDLSWLQFNERVLDEARIARNPLLERIKFLAISASNLDEFFMIRFPSLLRAVNVARKSKSGREYRQIERIQDSILENVARFTARQSETLDLLSSELEAFGIHIVRQPKKDEFAYELGRQVFRERVLPSLGPAEKVSQKTVAKLKNLRTLVKFQNGLGVQVSRLIPPVIVKSLGESDNTFVFFLDDLLFHHLGDAIELEGEPGLIRITRDADIQLDLDDDDSESIPEVIRSSLRRRDLGRATRIQYYGNLSNLSLQKYLKTLRIDDPQAFYAQQTFCLHGLWALVQGAPTHLRDNPALLHPPFRPQVQNVFEDRKRIFKEIRDRDILLHHPYDSFDGYVRFCEAASEDPKVTHIQQTLYRTDAHSPVVDALKRAAKKGKKVRVFIELRARFDEMNNLKMAEELRKAGAQVSFGIPKLKLHAKVALVARQEKDGARLYVHLSTGNYNSATARMYEDLAILTANPEVAADASDFFRALWAGEVPKSFRKLLSAPAMLHRRLLNLIHSEMLAARAGREARIVIKVNALVDERVIQKLYQASQSGVKVDLIVRGPCSLVPGVKDLSENIRVMSLVDRFLEHSRIYYFQSTRSLYLSSADSMPRNFFSRLELAFPVLDPTIYEFIEREIIPTYLADTSKGRELTPQGAWKRRTKPWLSHGSRNTRAQFHFIRLHESINSGKPASTGTPEEAEGLEFTEESEESVG